MSMVAPKRHPSETERQGKPDKTSCTAGRDADKALTGIVEASRMGREVGAHTMGIVCELYVTPGTTVASGMLE
jgi:hypothetical protein